MSPAATIKRTPIKLWVPSLDFFTQLNWLDGRPLRSVIEPYRQALFTRTLDTWDQGHLHYNLALMGRGKKNFKTADLVLAGLFACVANDSPGGNQCFIVANDEGQAADDLELAKKLLEVNPILQRALKVTEKAILRRDGRGFLKILPAQFAVGEHGKTYRFLGIDEIHGHRDWALLEALQLDPTRVDAQMWITSYASIHHKPGVPLFDLMAQGKAGADPRMVFSWYGADYCTDSAFADRTPEERANPSMGTWPRADYLVQQAKRLPAHQYRRLHLNLPGLPEGSAYTAEAIMGAVARGVKVRKPVSGIHYFGFVDMSGGSSDDATAGVSHREEGRWILDGVWHQAQPAPFNPRLAVERFAGIFKAYGITDVWGDNFGGKTFWYDFAQHGLMYYVSAATASQLYEAFAVPLNAGEVVLVDETKLEQQLLGLIWRGGKIDHPSGEHDDYANAAVGALMLAHEAGVGPLGPTPEEEAHHREQERAVERYLGHLPTPPGGFNNLALDDEGAPIDRRYARGELWFPPPPPERGYVDMS
jgi:hypothetical protein